MHRRHFLGRAVGGTASIGLLNWLSACAGRSQLAEVQGGDQTATRWSPSRELAEAWGKARAAGQPMLVIVIPQDQEARYERGHAWGELLMNGSDATLAELAPFELACGEMEAIRVTLDGVTGVPEEEHDAVLVDPDGRATGINLPMAEVELGSLGQLDDLEQRLLDRMHLVEAALSAALAPNVATLEHRARRATGSPLVVDPRAPGERSPLEQTELFPAAVRLHAEQHPPQREATLKLLADVVRRQLQFGSPAGAPWATSQGCGVRVEGQPENHGIACGMGHVPEVSRRFLYFYRQV